MITQNQRYYYHIFSITLISITLTSVSARFFPDPSSMPAWNSSNAPPGAWDGYKNFTGCSRGKTYDGLSKLKNYFNHFGYIPNAPPSNFTDDFDEALESAVRTYQKNFNLNVTGELDDATMNYIVKPRCGVADIINGTTSMNSGKFNSSSTNFHTVAHYSFFPGQPRWPEGTQTLTYAFDPSENLDDATKQVFANAFNQWSKVTTITFTEATSYSSSDIKIGFYSGDHGDGEAFDGVLGTLAHAFSPTDGRLHLDKAEDWVVNGDVTESSLSNAVDLESVVVHEIGHLLGLGHSSIEEAIMYPTISSRTKKVELESDDIEGIQMLYGSNPNFTGTTTATSRDRDSSFGGRHGVSLFWSLVFLGFGFLSL